MLYTCVYPHKMSLVMVFTQDTGAFLYKDPAPPPHQQPEAIMGVFLLSLAILAGVSADLITIDPNYDASSIAACSDEAALSCVIIKVDIEALNEEEIDLPGGVILSKQDNPGDNSVTFYDDNGAEATFSYSNGEIYGEIELDDGSMFVLEPCSDVCEGCHVLMGEDLTVLSNLELNEVDAWSLIPDDVDERALTYPEGRAVSALVQQGIDDTDTVVTYSLKVFFVCPIHTTQLLQS